jgi:hypothetical protein
MNETHKSEVTRLKEQIMLEYQAAQRVFTDFTPIAQHEFITKRQEHIADCYLQLKQYITPQEAIALISDIEEAVHPSASSSGNTS